MFAVIGMRGKNVQKKIGKDIAEASNRNTIPQLISREQLFHLTSEYSDEF